MTNVGKFLKERVATKCCNAAERRFPKERSMNGRYFPSRDSVAAAAPLATARSREASVARRPAPWSAGDDEFLRMLQLMRPHGGLFRAQQLQARIDAMGVMESGRGGVCSIEHWIEARHAFGLWWSDQLWLPMLQFDDAQALPYPALAGVLRVLDDTFDDREIALWLVTPNSWLDEQLPAALLKKDPPELTHAARADRYVARG
jgi:hypothetical protein